MDFAVCREFVGVHSQSLCRPNALKHYSETRDSDIIGFVCLDCFGGSEGPKPLRLCGSGLNCLCLLADGRTHLEFNDLLVLVCSGCGVSIAELTDQCGERQ